MRMKRTILERNAERGDSPRELALQIDEGGRAGPDANPQDPRRTARWKRAEGFEGDVERQRIDIAADRVNDRRHPGILDVAEKHERQM